MKRILLGLGALLLSATASYAQDVHFTQYFTSPLTLNPALTGLVNCDLRIAGNYRTQWNSVTANPYTTGTVSYDMNVLKNKLRNGDRMGVGVIALYDKSGSGALTNTTFGFSAAYHKALGGSFDGETRNHTLSLGIQGTLVQKKIDFAKLVFGDEINIYNGDPTNPRTEKLPNSDVSYPDFSAGLHYTGRFSEKSLVYAGFSTYHLTTPIESFLGSDSTHIHRRYTATLGGSFNLNENIYLYASSLYQNQASQSEFLIGSAVGFVLNPGFDAQYSQPTIFYAGAWYRNNDAICPYLGLDFKKATIGLSYDVNISSLSPATNNNGAMELSLIYNGCINKRESQPRVNVACPKF